MKSIIDIHEIIKLLPHRFPFLLIDRVISLDPDKSVVALKNVTMNEPFFTGHFPERPVMPGVMIIEAMAQAAGVLAYKSAMASPGEGGLFYLAGVDHARFRRVVEPGDQLRIEVVVLRHKLDIWKFEGKAYVGDELACSAELMSSRRTNG